MHLKKNGKKHEENYIEFDSSKTITMYNINAILFDKQ